MKRQSEKLHVAGEPVNWIGVNFWSSVGGARMWRDYDPSVVADELATMREHGMSLTRSFFFWDDFMPSPSTLDEEVVNRYRDFLDKHEALGMTTIPTFIVGHMSGENWDPSWRNGRDLYSDVWFVAQQAWYVRELAKRFAGHPAIAGWLLTNEVPIYGSEATGGFGLNDPRTIAAWSQILLDALRLGGATQPISIGDGVWGREIYGRDNGFRVRELVDLIDFHGPHVYRMESDPVRQNLGAAYICELLDIGDKPVIVEEFGLSSDYVSEVNAAHYYRQVLHNTLLAGATGWLAWNNTDYDGLSAEDPYYHHPFEMHFGLTDSSGKPKAQALEMKRFAELAERIGMSELARPDAEAAIVVSAFLESGFPFTHVEDATKVADTTLQAYVAAREADIPVGLAREVDGIPTDCKLYIVPSTKQLTTTGWAQLRERAAAGATVYASYFVGDHGPQRGLWWPNLDETFGVRKQTRYGLVDLVEQDEVVIRFTQAFGEFAAGEELVVPVGGVPGARSFLPVEAVEAEVLAVDSDGRPALLRNRVGEGWMILSTYPLEFFASARANSNPDPTWRIYDALASEADITRPVRVADPRVLVAEMIHTDGRVFVWFVSQADEPLEVEPELGGGRLVDLDGKSVDRVALSPLDVVVLVREPAGVRA